MTNALQYPSDHWAADPDPESSFRRYLERHAAPFNQVEKKMFLSLLPQDMRGLSVLDYGCGCGMLSVLCAKRGAHVIGLDQSEHAVRTAQWFAAKEGVSGQCQFEVANEVRGGPFDLVIGKDVIEHVEDDAGWVSSVAKSLKPCGMLVLSTQNLWSLTYVIEGTYQRLREGNKKWMGWDPTHVRFYNPFSLRRVLEENGVTVSRWASMYLIPYDILSWLFLLKVRITIPLLSAVDYLLGKVFPFNRLGWGLMVVCRKA